MGVRHVAELDEFELIARIEARLAHGSGRELRAPKQVALGIGDDAALLRMAAQHELVVSTDAAVQGVQL